MRIVVTPFYRVVPELLGLDFELVEPEDVGTVEADLVLVPRDLWTGDHDDYSAGYAVPVSAASFSSLIASCARVGVLAGVDDRGILRAVKAVLDVWEPVGEGCLWSEKRFIRSLALDLGLRLSERCPRLRPDYEGGRVPSHGFEDALEALRVRSQALSSSPLKTSRR